MNFYLTGWKKPLPKAKPGPLGKGARGAWFPWSKLVHLGLGQKLAEGCGID